VTTVAAEVGPMVTGGDIEDGILGLLQEWLGPYICEAERQHGLTAGDTPWPRGWAITGRDLQKLNSDQLPCVVLLAGGIAAPPRKEAGLGAYSATWGVELAVVFEAAWGRDSRRRAQLYARAMQLVVQQLPLVVQGQPTEVDWRGELYDEMDFASSRSYSAAVCSFNVTCREVAWANGGPPPDAQPPTDATLPFTPWVEVVETDTTVENVGAVPTNQTPQGVT
jgi:hypothetical protein